MFLVQFIYSQQVQYESYSIQPDHEGKAANHERVKMWMGWGSPSLPNTTIRASWHRAIPPRVMYYSVILCSSKWNFKRYFYLTLKCMYCTLHEIKAWFRQHCVCLYSQCKIILLEVCPVLTDLNVCKLSMFLVLQKCVLHFQSYAGFLQFWQRIQLGTVQSKYQPVLLKEAN